MEQRPEFFFISCPSFHLLHLIAMSELSRCESVYYTPCWRIRPTVIEAASKHLTTTFLIGNALHLILLVDL
ncbi:hypothetical protein HBI12_004770 [Parastagonospora nodorum]|nr:hypothetical protein HBI12_004770 [Parastagonospora nodorum]